MICKKIRYKDFRNIENAEEMNDVEIKSFIDVLLSEDISEMLGSSESLSKRVQSKIKSLDEKNGRLYRIYKDGVALDTFFKKVCGESVGNEIISGTIQETLKSIKNLKTCDVRFIFGAKNYCLALVTEK